MMDHEYYSEKCVDKHPMVKIFREEIAKERVRWKKVLDKVDEEDWEGFLEQYILYLENTQCISTGRKEILKGLKGILNGYRQKK